MTYMDGATYWQKMKLIGFMLSFLTNMIAIFFVSLPQINQLCSTNSGQ